MSSKEWNDFKNKYPEMENFFHMEFESLSDYQREKDGVTNTFNSLLLPTPKQLSSTKSSNRSFTINVYD